MYIIFNYYYRFPNMGGALQHGKGGPWSSQNCGWVGHNVFGPTNNWPVCSLILHCGQLILRKIISKIGASRCQILRLKWHQIRFLLGLRPRPRWGSYSAFRLLHLFKGPTSKGMDKNGRRRRKGKGEGRGQVEGGIWPTQKFWCDPPICSQQLP